MKTQTCGGCGTRLVGLSVQVVLLCLACVSDTGELGRVQADAAAARSARDVVGAAFTQPPHVQTRAVRAHMEHSIAAAKALQSPYEWKRHLISYARMLASDGDEVSMQASYHTISYITSSSLLAYCQICACPNQR